MSATACSPLRWGTAANGAVAPLGMAKRPVIALAISGERGQLMSPPRGHAPILARSTSTVRLPRERARCAKCFPQGSPRVEQRVRSTIR